MTTMQQRQIRVTKTRKGFGLSLIFRGLDKFEQKDTGIFVARVVEGGAADRSVSQSYALTLVLMLTLHSTTTFTIV